MTWTSGILVRRLKKRRRHAGFP